MNGAVLFDCDSTLAAVEGIDLLARRAGIHDRIAALTRDAMEGTVALEAIYTLRLDLIRPNREAVAWLGDQYVANCVPGAVETVAALHDAGREVHIVSGGVRQAVQILAAALGIAAVRVHAVDVYFGDDGSYHGFDVDSPLVRAGGKAEICRRLLKTVGQAIMVGDGITDLEAAEAGVTVIGYGGVVRRQAVAERANIYIDSFGLLSVRDAILGKH